LPHPATPLPAASCFRSLARRLQQRTAIQSAARLRPRLLQREVAACTPHRGHQGKVSRRPVSCASQRHPESSQVRIGATSVSTHLGPSAGGGCNCFCSGDHADGAGPWNSSAASEVHDMMILALGALLSPHQPPTTFPTEWPRRLTAWPLTSSPLGFRVELLGNRIG
jgi:hypothetical protein